MLSRIEENGYEAYLVGGCVRDELLGCIPGDHDMAVSCTPEETKACFTDFRTVDTGLKHGTVTVVSDGHNVELTTFRCDGKYSDNRRPDAVEFTRDIHADVARRDLTVNAMAYSPTRGLIDDHGGREDLKNGVLRCVGDPLVRFEEDALRIMRTLRFASVLGFTIEENTARALFIKKELLGNISPERIFAELQKLLAGNARAEVLIKFREIFLTVLPELASADEEAYRELAAASARCDTPAAALSALLSKGTAEQAEAVCRRLRTDNRFRKTVLYFLTNKDREFFSCGEVKRFAGETGKEKLPALLAFRRALGRTKDEYLEEAVKKTAGKDVCLTAGELAVNGNDLLRLGYSGRAVGDTLAALLRAVTDEKTENTREALLAFLTSGSDCNR